LRTGQKRPLRAGIDDAPPIPIQAGDPALGNFRGYEVDLLTNLAERLDYTLEYHRALWSRITGDLISGRLDLVCSAATVTEQRQAEVSLCSPHLKLRLALVVREDSLNSLNAATSRFGVRHGTTAQAFLHGRLELPPAMVSELNEELYKALSRGQLDAVIDDSPMAMHFAKSFARLQYKGRDQCCLINAGVGRHSW
jgi:ABC-type amino acid transport substrate-binding protein